MRLQLQTWTSVQRTDQNNVRLGATLCFVAGATNAGGFLAVGEYTSHMSGIVSSVADNVVLGKIGLALAGLMYLMAFIAGAMTTTCMVNWSLRRHKESAYGWPCRCCCWRWFGALFFTTSETGLSPR